MRNNATIRCLRIAAAPRGFSLVELMVVVTVIGVLVALTVPSYQRALEQSRADIAAANLRAVWAAERLYWLDYHSFTSDMDHLQELGLLDSTVVFSTTGYVYSITSAGTNTLQAVAVRTGGDPWTGQLTLDENGLVDGALQAFGQSDITPSFQ